MRIVNTTETCSMCWRK